MRALITGVGGFVGRHLRRHLHDEGDDVFGLARASDAVGLEEGTWLRAVDLLDRSAVQEVLADVRPDAVYHLAAQSSSSESLGDPWGTLSNNLRSQMNLFEAAIALGLRPRVLVVGSSDEYGHLRPRDLPTHEDVPLRPVSPYAVSKVGQDVLAYQYFAQHSLPCVRVRPFSHTGPGHDERFVIPSFARQVALIEAGGREPVVRVGNLDVFRDFTDVRDMVRAYRLAIAHGAPGDVYNLGSGVSLRVGDVLNALVDMSRVPIHVEVDPALVRLSDMPRQQADIRKFRSLTGWSPAIAWATTLRDTLDYWRQRVRQSTTIPSGVAGQ